MKILHMMNTSLIILKMLEVIDQNKKCKKCPGLTKLLFDTVSLGKNTDILFIGESPAKMVGSPPVRLL